MASLSDVQRDMLKTQSSSFFAKVILEVVMTKNGTVLGGEPGPSNAIFSTFEEYTDFVLQACCEAWPAFVASLCECVVEEAEYHFCDGEFNNERFYLFRDLFDKCCPMFNIKYNKGAFPCDVTRALEDIFEDVYYARSDDTKPARLIPYKD